MRHVKALVLCLVANQPLSTLCAYYQRRVPHVETLPIPKERPETEEGKSFVESCVPEGSSVDDLMLSPSAMTEFVARTCNYVDAYRKANDIQCGMPFSSDCFDRGRCGADGANFSIYIPSSHCSNWSTSDVLDADYHNEDNGQIYHWRALAGRLGILAQQPEDACMFLYPLNNAFNHHLDIHYGALGHDDCIRTSEFWNGGRNWVIVSRSDNGVHEEIELFGRALLVTANTLSCWHRRGFDIGTPLDLPLGGLKGKAATLFEIPASKRKYLATFKGSIYPAKAHFRSEDVAKYFTTGRAENAAKWRAHHDLSEMVFHIDPNGGQRSNLLRLHNGKDIIVVGKCKNALPSEVAAAEQWCNCIEKTFDEWDFEDLLDARFALCPGGYGPESFRMVEALAAGSIPVFIGDGYELPYSDLVDWSKFSVYFTTAEIPLIPQVLRAITPRQADAMQRAGSEACRTTICGDNGLRVFTLLHSRLLEGLPGELHKPLPLPIDQCDVEGDPRTTADLMAKPEVLQEWHNCTCQQVDSVRAAQGIDCGGTALNPDCFDRGRCGSNGTLLSVYVPPSSCGAWPSSSELESLAGDHELNDRVFAWRQVAKRLGILAEHPEEACAFLYPLALTFNKVRDLHYGKLGVDDCIRTSPYWQGGRNWVIASRADHGVHENMELFGKAMLVTAHTLSCWHRRGYDIAIPSVIPLDLVTDGSVAEEMRQVAASKRKYLATFKGSLYPRGATLSVEQVVGYFEQQRAENAETWELTGDLSFLSLAPDPNGAQRNNLLALHNDNDTIVLGRCKGEPPTMRVSAWCGCIARDYESYSYWDDLMDTRFALVPASLGMHSKRLVEAMSLGAIPVIVCEGCELPYSDRVQWTDFSLRFAAKDIVTIPDILRSISPAQADEMQRKSLAACQQYVCGDVMAHNERVLRILIERLSSA